jgi:hypothetical protein
LDTTVAIDPVVQQSRPALVAMYGTVLDRVVPFGSHARSDAEPESDYDLAEHTLASREPRPRTEAGHTRISVARTKYNFSACSAVDLPFSHAGQPNARTSAC